MKTEIKICGVRDPKIAKQAIKLGARYIGIMCFPGSKRSVEPELGKTIADAVKSENGIPVAVFMDADDKIMLSISEQLGVTTVQLHGSIARQYHSKLPKNYQRIYVLHVAPDGMIQPDVDQGFSQLIPDRDYILYDNLQGGIGKTFDLNHFSNPYPMRFFLAGGFTDKNVGKVIQTVHPHAVDVSTGVESKIGVKDIKKIKRFIQSVREIKE